MAINSFVISGQITRQREYNDTSIEMLMKQQFY